MPADTPMVLVPREVLEPFARLWAEHRSDLLPADDKHAWGFNRADLYWGDIRKLAEALSASPGEGLGASASPIPTEQAGGPVVDDRLHDAIRQLRQHVSTIQAAKRGVAEGKSLPSHYNPMLDCINALPSIIRQLDMAELEIEAAFERYEDAEALSAPSTTSTAEQLGTEANWATCQACGGPIEGWICQSCDREFREDDAGNLVFDDDGAGEGDAPVAWRWRWKAETYGVPNAKPGRWNYTEEENCGDPRLKDIAPLYTHPTPATLEGLREKVAAAFRAGIRYAAQEMDALADPSSEHGCVRAKAADTYADAREWLTGLSEKEVDDAILAALQPQAQGGE